MDSLSMWTFSDAHVGTDAHRGRKSLAEAIGQAEDWDWDLALDMGDMSGSQRPPVDTEGEEIVEQFSRSLRKHDREQIYSLAGNHDRSALGEPDNWLWRRWLDPIGENSSYSRVDSANILFLMMSDINEPTQLEGRGTLGGNPGGVVSGETFEWWKERAEANQDKIIVSCHHYVLKDTTVASGEWEGMRRQADGTWRSHYHGYKERGTPQGASYLHWVNSVPDAGAFESYLADHPRAIDIWLGGHTHTHPDDRHGDKSHIEKRWGVRFVNVAALTAHHGDKNVPMSRMWTIAGRHAQIRCHLHTSDYAPQGWYDPAERIIDLSRPFSWAAAQS